MRRPDAVSRLVTRRSTGFTLVELLVVITIIGILMGLLLPAVNAARESARKTQCKNNIGQIAKAALAHESNQGFLPVSGWGWGWAGDPNQGCGANQPGGFFFNILPYMDQMNLWSTGQGDTAAKLPTDLGAASATPVASFICPSRRQLQAYPFSSGNLPSATTANWTPSSTAVVGHTDYATNGGSNAPPTLLPGPTSASAVASYPWNSSATTSPSVWDGGGISLTYQRATLKLAAITDGTAYTLMAAEKYMDPDYYYTGSEAGDVLGWDIGMANAWVRWGGPATTPQTSLVPAKDAPVTAGSSATPPTYTAYIFGSVHSGSFNAVFCDGSVRPLSYNIDPTTFGYLCNRSDGNLINDALLQQ